MNEIMVYDAQNEPISRLVQWDRNITIMIEEADISKNYNVHFFNHTSDEACVMESSYSGGILRVKVPNILLTQEHTIFGYIYKEESTDEGRSIYGFRIAVRKRAKPADYVYVESEEYITFSKILAECQEYAQSASTSATNAKASETKAASSERVATQKATESSNSANLSKSYAVGGTGTRTGEDADNSKYYKEKAGQSADLASGSANDAELSATKSESFAQQVEAEKGEIEELVQDYLIAETKQQLEEIKEYLAQIQAAKDGFTLHVSGGDAHSFDVQNIDGGNAVTIDNYKYLTGNAISID